MYNFTVTITVDDYERLRDALGIAIQKRANIISRSTSDGNILKQEHIIRRYNDVDEVLVAAFNAAGRASSAPPCDVVEGCQNPSIDCVGGEVYYCAEHEGGAYDAYQAWQASPERAQRAAEQS